MNSKPTLSYATFIDERNLFRKSGTKSGGEFNYYDTPGLKFFKLFFYFENGDSTNPNSDFSSGLLSPTWLYNVKEKDLYKYNSAWSYLKLNCEDDRAKLLEKFVNLLSNISSESPWYFSELNGLDAAVERKVLEKNLNIDEQRKKISIKCLPDAYDDRIATLLDLYRSIVWSWQMKREIIPSNLRKFDMGIFLYESTVAPFHVSENLDYMEEDEIYDEEFEYRENSSIRHASIDKNSSDYMTSYKYIELHNCEIDYDSIKSGFSALNNKEGFSPEITIDIYFDDCYESRYNEFNMKEFGDMITLDLYRLKENFDSKEVSNDDYEQFEDFYGSNSPRQAESFTNLKQSKSKIKKITNNNFLSNAIGQVVNVGIDAVTGLVKRAVLGNLYTFSLTKIAKQLKGVVEGDVWSTARGVSEYIKDAKQRKENQVTIGHSLFTKPKKILPTVQRIGNLAKSQTIANNL